jgi:hypothetical protein
VQSAQLRRPRPWFATCAIRESPGPSTLIICYSEAFSDYHSRHFRIEPANAVDANDKIRRVENVTLGEIQHGAVDLRVFSPLN